MRWLYTEVGGSLDSEPPAAEGDTKYILFALKVYAEMFSTLVLDNTNSAQISRNTTNVVVNVCV